MNVQCDRTRMMYSKKWFRKLALVALLAGMIYAASAVTTGSVYAACDCSVYTQQLVNALCNGICYPATSGHLDYCDPTSVVIRCNNGCYVEPQC